MLYSFQHLLILETGSHLLSYVVNYLLKTNDKVRLLLPEIFCDQTLKFVRSLDAGISFYPLNKDFSPIRKSLSQQLSNKGVNLIVFVHYFGHYQSSVNSLKKSLLNENVVILEDFAHFPTAPNYKRFSGDYLLFSPRKHHPISSGALLFSKEYIEADSVGPPDYWSFSLWNILGLFKNYCYTPRGSLFNKFKRSFHKKKPSTYPKYSSVPDFNKDYIDNFFCSSLDVFDNKRNERFRQIKDQVESYFTSQSAIEFTDKDFPYAVPILLDSREKQRRALILKKNGLPVMIWPDLPEEVSNKVDETELAGKSVLLFMCHSQIDVLKCIKKIGFAEQEASVEYSS